MEEMEIVDTSDTEERAELDRMRRENASNMIAFPRVVQKPQNPAEYSDDDLDLFRVPDPTFEVPQKHTIPNADEPSQSDPKSTPGEPSDVMIDVSDLSFGSADTVALSDLTVAVDVIHDTEAANLASSDVDMQELPLDETIYSQSHRSFTPAIAVSRQHTPFVSIAGTPPTKDSSASPLSFGRSPSFHSHKGPSTSWEALATEIGPLTPATSVLSSPKPSPTAEVDGSRALTPQGAGNSHTIEVEGCPVSPRGEYPVPEIPLDLSNERYGLRRRTHVQLNPYTVERSRYKISLRNNPDAIVKYKSPPRRESGSKMAEQAFEEWFLEDQTETQTRHIRRPSTDAHDIQAGQQRFQLSLNLDEDDRLIDAQMRKLRRDARERELREHAKEKSRRIRPLPVQREAQPMASSSKIRIEDIPMIGRQRSTHLQILSDDEDSILPSLSLSQEHVSAHHSDDSFAFNLCSPNRSPRTLELSGFDQWSPLISDHRDKGLQSDAPVSTRSNHQVPGRDAKDAESHITADSSDEREGASSLFPRRHIGKDKSFKQFKALKHVWPKIMIDRFAEAQRTTPPRKRRSSSSSPASSVSEHELAPGMSKSRVVHMNVPIIVDSESETEDEISLVDPPPPVIDLEEDDGDVPVVDLQAWANAPRQGPLPRQFSLNTPSSRRCEPDLIDRMLSRATREPRQVRPHPLGRPLKRQMPSSRKHGGKRRRTQASYNVDGGPTTLYDSTRTSPDVTRQARKASKTGGTNQSMLNTNRNLTSPTNPNAIRDGEILQNPGSWMHTSPAQQVQPQKRPGASRNFKQHRMSQSVLTDFLMSEERRDDAALNNQLPEHAFLPGKRLGQITLHTNCGVTHLPDYLAFGLESYLGSGQLQELKQLVENPDRCHPLYAAFSGFGILLSASSKTEEVLEALPIMSDKLYDWATSRASDDSSGDEKGPAKKFARFVALYLSANVCKWPQEQIMDFTDSLLKHLGHLHDRFQSFVGTAGDDWSGRESILLWTLLELQVRVAVVNQQTKISDERQSRAIHCLESTTRSLLRLLLQFGIENAFSAATQPQSLMVCNNAASLNLQTWICLIHLLPNLRNLKDNRDTVGIGLLWQEVEKIPARSSGRYDPDKSEQLWRTIFTLCAIAEFTASGSSSNTSTLAPSWNTVNEALKLVNLNADEAEDKKVSAEALVKRDRFTRLVTSRCFLLCSYWKWSLHDGAKVLLSLNEIFRSRNFANLIYETCDFPDFIRAHDVTRLKDWTDKDTSHTFLMKSLIRFGDDAKRAKGSQFKDTQLAKLLSVLVPVSKPRMERDIPPSNCDFSQLYNRFTACFVAILLCPEHADPLTHANGKVKQCKLYADFAGANYPSRHISIRCMMELTILYRHLSLPLDELFSWSEEILKVLFSELDGSIPGRDTSKTVICIQMIVCSAKNALEIHSLEDPPRPLQFYPDKRFLDPAIAYIQNVPKQLQSNDWNTTEQIKKLLDAFLAIRKAVMLPPINPKDFDNPESQDEYGFSDLNMDDPVLLQALGVQELPKDDSRTLDLTIAQAMVDTFCPYFYTRVCKQVEEDSEALSSKRADRSLHHDFRWIDSWVQCAQVAVINGLKTWDSFVTLGSCSWTRIADSTWRRRVGMRFLYKILEEDPRSFKGLKDSFLAMFFQCLVTPDVLMEHEYVSLAASTDEFSHPLLEDTCVSRGEEGLFPLSAGRFLELRLHLIQDTCSSLSKLSCGTPTAELQAAIGQATEYMSTLITTMGEHLVATRNQNPDYYRFCAEVVRSLTALSVLGDDGAFAGHLARIRSSIPIEFFR